MARVVLATMWAGGNVPPLVALTELLVAAGHEVDVVADERLRADFEPVGARFVSGRDRLSAVLAGAPPGPPAAPADLAIVDFMLPVELSVAEASGVPFAAFAHTTLQRHLDGHFDIVGAFVPLEVLNDRRRDLGLDAVDGARVLLDRATAVLAAMPEVLDRPTPNRPTHLHYLGSLMPGAGADAGWSPPPSLGADRPLVMVSMGTTPMDEEPVLQRILDAFGDESVRVVATVGAHVDRTSLTAPANALVCGHVRHAASLPHAAVAVHHGGLGTTVAATAIGVPQLVIPLGRDQPDNAARVAELGIGVVLDPAAAIDDLRSELRRVLVDATFAARARAVAAEADLGGTPAGALAVGQSVLGSS